MKLMLKQVILLFILEIINIVKSQDKPYITENPKDTNGLSLQKLILTCNAVGNPKPTITWYKEGNVVESYKDKPVSSNIIIENNQLIFLHLDIQDEGIYYCNATNTYGWTISKNASVNLAYLNKNIVGPESKKTASVGETVVLNCKPPDGIPKPNISWKFKGTPIEQNKRVKMFNDGKNLRIDNAKRTDSGHYSCTAKNYVDQVESLPSLLIVRQKPYFIRVPTNIEVKVNDAAIFRCEVSGDPKPTIIWLRDNNKKIPTSRTVLLQNKGLRINRIQLSDMGNYLCQASNSAGTIEAIAKLTVVSSPGFLETPEDKEAGVGDSVTFKCRISGSPLPTVTWTHNGEHFIADDSISRRTNRIRVSSEGNLVISPVKLSDSGKYECKASSYTGRIQSSAFLTVKDSLQFHPPIIDILPQNQSLRLGLTATFYCKPIEGQNVEIAWFKNGFPLQSVSDPRIIHLTSGTLKINSLRLTDAGNYTCKASLNKAYTEWTVYLKIYDRNDVDSSILQATDDLKLFPNIPTNFEIVDRGDSSITLKWDLQNTDSNSDYMGTVNHYLVQYYPYKSRKGWYYNARVGEGTIKIENLQPNTGYRFLIRSVNEIGIGRPNVLPFVVFTTKKQHISKLNYDQLKNKVDSIFCDELKKKSVSTDQVTIVWRINGPNNSLKLLSGFIARYKRVPLGRCLVNNKASSLEHCSLNENFLGQIEQELNNPKSPLNKEGRELTQFVPIQDWNDGDIAYSIITGLTPFVCYEIYLQPYLEHPKFGKLIGNSNSKSLAILTYDSLPTAAPKNLNARWLSNTSIKLNWQPANPSFINGILKGYSLHIIGNNTNNTRSIEVSPKSTSVTIQDLQPLQQYRLSRGHNPVSFYTVHIAALTCKGEGVRSPGLHVIPTDSPSQVITLPPPSSASSLLGNNNRLFQHRTGGNQASSIAKTMDINNGNGGSGGLSSGNSVTRQPWFISIVIVGTCLWVLICAIVVFVCRSMYLRGLLYKSGYSNGTKLLLSNGGVNNNINGNHDNTANTNQAMKDSNNIILQPLIANGNLGNQPNNSVSSDAYPTDQIAQRRFHDSLSSGQSNQLHGNNNNNNNNNGCLTPNFDVKHKQQRIMNNNVAPYASTSLLQPLPGLAANNNTSNHLPGNQHMSPVSSNDTGGGINPDFANVPLLIPNSNHHIDWQMSPQLQSGRIIQSNCNDSSSSANTMSHHHHQPHQVIIPPPPEFPPPPAPISPSNHQPVVMMMNMALNNNNNCANSYQGDDGSYASCPVDMGSNSNNNINGCHDNNINTNTNMSPLPGYLWSGKHNNTLVPMPGEFIDLSNCCSISSYIDYSCGPHNPGMLHGAMACNNGNIASSSADSFIMSSPNSQSQFIQDSIGHSLHESANSGALHEVEEDHYSNSVEEDDDEEEEDDEENAYDICPSEDTNITSTNPRSFFPPPPISNQMNSHSLTSSNSNSSSNPNNGNNNNIHQHAVATHFFNQYHLGETPIV